MCFHGRLKLESKKLQIQTENILCFIEKEKEVNIVLPFVKFMTSLCLVKM